VIGDNLSLAIDDWRVFDFSGVCVGLFFYLRTYSVVVDVNLDDGTSSCVHARFDSMQRSVTTHNDKQTLELPMMTYYCVTAK
jgi:hypothetical protein